MIFMGSSPNREAENLGNNVVLNIIMILIMILVSGPRLLRPRLHALAGLRLLGIFGQDNTNVWLSVKSHQTPLLHTKGPASLVEDKILS